MLFYYNAIIMKQGSQSISSAAAVMIHRDSVLSQKAGLGVGGKRVSVLYQCLLS